MLVDFVVIAVVCWFMLRLHSLFTSSLFLAWCWLAFFFFFGMSGGQAVFSSLLLGVFSTQGVRRMG